MIALEHLHFLKELAMFYKNLAQRCSQEFINSLRNCCYSSIPNCPQHLVERLMSETMNGDIKKIRQCILELVKAAQSQKV